MVGPHIRRPQPPEVMIFNDSSDNDNFMNHVFFIIRRSRQRDVIVLNDIDSNKSNGILVRSRQTPPYVVDVGLTSYVFVSPACGGFGWGQLYDGDGGFGSPINVGLVVQDFVDEDVVFDSAIHMGPAVDVDGDFDVGPNLDLSKWAM